MTTYHVKPNGDPGACKATAGNCPFGNRTPHGDFPNLKEARAWAEKEIAEEYAREQLRPPHEKVALAAARKLKELIASSDEWRPQHRSFPKDLDTLRSPVKSANLCLKVSKTLRDISLFSDDYEGPKLGIVWEEPRADFLNYHMANTFIHEGETYVMDFSYSQIDDTQEHPFIAPLETWKANVLRAAVDPKPSIREQLYHEDGRPKLKGFGYVPEPDGVYQKLGKLIKEAQETHEPEQILWLYESYSSVASDYPTLKMAIAKNNHTPERLLRKLSEEDGMTSVYAKKNLESRGLVS